MVRLIIYLSWLVFTDGIPPKFTNFFIGRTVVYHKTAFRVPFRVELGDQDRIEHVYLWVSRDLGRSWNFGGSVKAQERFFRFEVEEDGLYWFAVQVVLPDGTKFPELTKLSVGIKVLIDTKGKIRRPSPPQVNRTTNGGNTTSLKPQQKHIKNIIRETACYRSFSMPLNIVKKMLPTFNTVSPDERAA